MGITGPFEIHPFAAPLGAEIRGVDLCQDPTGDVVFRILDAFHAHQILLFRNQKLTHKRQLQVSEWFGPRYVAPADLPILGDETQPAVVPVSNVVAGGVLGDQELAAHSDLQYMPVPLLGAMLHAVEVPEHGGRTAWSNLYRAYDELDAETRERIDGLRAWAFNPYAGAYAALQIGGPAQKYVDHEVPRFFHPIVRTHPATGRKSIYVSYLTAGIEGISDPEAEHALLRRLQRHVDQPHLYYWHTWQPGDVIVWDNRCTNHKREAFDPKSRRVMYRVQIAGTRPF